MSDSVSSPGWTHLGPALELPTIAFSTLHPKQAHPLTISHILISILSHLKPNEIRKAQWINKDFKKASEHEVFDEPLFRIRKGKPPITYTGPMILHPLLANGRRHSLNSSKKYAKSGRTTSKDTAIWPPVSWAKPCSSKSKNDDEDKIEDKDKDKEKDKKQKGSGVEDDFVRVSDVMTRGRKILLSLGQLASEREWDVALEKTLSKCRTFHRMSLFIAAHNPKRQNLPRNSFTTRPASPSPTSLPNPNPIPPPKPKSTPFTIPHILNIILDHLVPHDGRIGRTLNHLSRQIWTEKKFSSTGYIDASGSSKEGVSFPTTPPFHWAHPTLVNRKFDLDDIRDILRQKLFPGFLHESATSPPTKSLLISNGLYLETINGTGRDGEVLIYDLMKIGKRVLELRSIGAKRGRIYRLRWFMGRGTIDYAISSRIRG